MWSECKHRQTINHNKLNDGGKGSALTRKTPISKFFRLKKKVVDIPVRFMYTISVSGGHADSPDSNPSRD
jgi:hypothetical protein